MKRFILKKVRVIPAVMIILLLFTGMTVFADEDTGAEQTSGDFTYTVSGQSVTITKYNGTDESVTVPETIGGNPVNIIAEGAFAENGDVRTVYLPESFMGAEDGAFSDEQVIVYYEPAPDQTQTESAGQTSSATQTSSAGRQTSGSQSGTGENGSAAAASQSENTDAAGDRGGITDNSGRLITVNDAGNLILIQEDGTEYVLDDTQNYTLKRDGAGNYYIRTAQGAPVDVIDGNKVEYTDMRGNAVSVDTATRMKTVTDQGNHAENDTENAEDPSEDDASGEEDAETEDADWEDADSDLTVPAEYLQAADAQDAGAVRTSSGKNKVIGAVIIAAVLAAVGGFAFWYYRRR